MLSDAHDDDCNYLKSALEDHLAADPAAAVFSDLAAFSGTCPGLRHHSPDLSVIFGVNEQQGVGDVSC